MQIGKVLGHTAPATTAALCASGRRAICVDLVERTSMTGQARTDADIGRRALQRAQTARRTVDEELAAMQRDGLMPSEGKAKANAARRLGISARTLERLLALAPA